MRYAFLIPIILFGACTVSTGDADTDYKVGQLYEHGRGVVQDMSEATTYYQKAAKAGSAKAQFTLGVLYREGNGVKQNLEKSVQWFHSAAMQGLAHAQYNVANAYRSGEGTAQDFALALEWYYKAAMQGYAPAAHNLGAMAGNGEGTPQSYAEAYKWLLLSEKLGMPADEAYAEKFRTSLSRESQTKIKADVQTLYDNIKFSVASSEATEEPS